MPHLATITLVIDDYDRAIAHYVDGMGFELVEDTDLGEGKRWVVVSPGPGGSNLLLAQAADDTQRAAIGNQAGGRVFLFLQSEDFWRDHKRLAGVEGIRFLEEPREEPYGTVVQFRDMYGNGWDLIQPR